MAFQLFNKIQERCAIFFEFKWSKLVLEISIYTFLCKYFKMFGLKSWCSNLKVIPYEASFCFDPIKTFLRQIFCFLPIISNTPLAILFVLISGIWKLSLKACLYVLCLHFKFWSWTPSSTMYSDFFSTVEWWRSCMCLAYIFSVASAFWKTFGLSYYHTQLKQLL